MEQFHTFDGRQELREYIAEMVEMCRHYFALAQRYAEIGDDTGLAYSVRKAMAYQRAVVETCCDLFAANSLAGMMEVTP